MHDDDHQDDNSSNSIPGTHASEDEAKTDVMESPFHTGDAAYPPGGGGAGGFPGAQAPAASSWTEGWNEGGTTIDDFFETLQLVARSIMGPVVVAWLALGAIELVFPLIAGLLTTGALYIDAASGLLSGAATAVTGLGWLVGVVVAAAKFSLFRPLLRWFFEGRDAVISVGDAIEQAKPVFVPVLGATILLSLATGVGVLFCVVGSFLAIFAFCQAPWLAATADLGTMDAMKASLARARRHPFPVMGAVAATLLFVGVGGCAQSFLGGAAGLVAGVFAPAGIFFGNLSTWLVAQFVGLLVFVFYASAFLTIEQVERGEPLGAV